MKVISICFFLICSSRLFAQYDYFDNELGHDSYERVYSRLIGEHIIGNIKELKIRSSSRITLHLIINKNGQIIEEREYVDTLRLARTATYSNQKLTKETEYYGGAPRSYVFYKYDKSGRLTTKDFSKKKNNRDHTARVTYQYDDNGRLVQRTYFSSKGGFDKFIYEGDSVIWKLIFNNHSTLKGVGKKIKRNESELIIFHKVDTTLDIGYLQRIKPIREYQRSWDDNRTFTQGGEFEYDSIGNKIALSITRSEFSMNRLLKTTSIHNTASLKGEFVTEYIYNSHGLLELEISKHNGNVNEIKYKYDDHGNRISHGGFTYRFLYDRNGNWTTRQCFYKKGSVKMINGVTKKYTEDSWIDEERREISYFK